MTDNRVCRGCGCTTDRACQGGCYWVKSDLCSACAEREVIELGSAVIAWAQRQGKPGTRTGKIGERDCRIMLNSDGVMVVDHIGVLIFNLGDDGAYLAPNYDAGELKPLFVKEARAA